MKYYLVAFIIDLIIGDPYFFPHPIKLIGNMIHGLEKGLGVFAKSPVTQRIAGVVLLIMTVLLSMAMVYIPLLVLKSIGPIYYITGVVYFSYAVLSTKCLGDEAVKVKNALETSLESGRKQVSYIVGRDTTVLSEKEVINATIETVAENTTDGIIAPLFFLFIGGPVLAMGYKAVSTLDSMVGYKNEKYIHFGWASAKMDDVLNFIPARIAGFVMAFASAFIRLDFKKSYKVLLRDHYNHASPNSAWTEAAAAGALNIQLGGTHTYFGVEMVKPTIGDNTRPVVIEDIRKMNHLMIATSCIFMAVSLVVIELLL